MRKMDNNTNEKSLVVIKNKNIFSRIFNFFNKLIKGNKNTHSNETKENIVNSIVNYENKDTGNVKEEITLDRIEKLFIDFRKGLVKEEDLSKEDKQKVAEKYKERIRKEKQEIEYLRQRIIQLRNLNTTNITSK